MDRLKAVIDTNVLVSSLIGKIKGNPKKIIDSFAKNKFSLVISPPILKELEDVLREPELKSIINAEEAFHLTGLIRIKGLFVIPAHKINLCRDIHDNKILEAASKANANFIVTGDADLLCLKDFPIPIITPKEFIKLLNK